jgi:LytR cell envelope-related transcriptional attenuator
VDYTEHLQQGFPWRTATVVVGALAALELVALIGLGATRLAAPLRTHATAAKAPAAVPVVHKRARHVVALPSHPLRPRSKLSVLVLNGNGINGAAGAKAVNLQTIGYGASRSEDAPRHDYARSMVLYVPGYQQEARRLGSDAGVGIVATLDGMRRSQLKGSQLVIVLGGS